MAKTEFLGLNLTEDDPLFEDWRKSLDGNNPEGQESNMQIIDKAMKDLSKNSGSGKSTIVLTMDSTPEDVENAHQEALAGNLDIIVYFGSIYRLAFVDSYEMYFNLYAPKIDETYDIVWESLASYILFFKDDTDTWQADLSEVVAPGFVFGTPEESEEYLLAYFDAARYGWSHVLLETHEGRIWFNLNFDGLAVEYLCGSTTLRSEFGDSVLWLKYDHNIKRFYEDEHWFLDYFISIHPADGKIVIYEDGDLTDLDALFDYLIVKYQEYSDFDLYISPEAFCPYICLETSNGRLPAIRVENETDFVFYNETTGEHYMAVMEDDGYTLTYWKDEINSESGSGPVKKKYAVTFNSPIGIPFTGSWGYWDNAGNFVSEEIPYGQTIMIDRFILFDSSRIEGEFLWGGAFKGNPLELAGAKVIEPLTDLIIENMWEVE